MTASAVRVGVGTRFAYDGEVVEIVELIATPAGNEVLLKSTRDQRVRRVALKELLYSSEARAMPEHNTADDDSELAGVVLAELTEEARAELLARAEHVREVGYCTTLRSGIRHSG
jgi:hypothetical protein